MVTVAVLGLVTGLARNRAPWERAAALGGIANIAIWPFTPFTEVVFFAVRYMAPGLLLGAILFASAPRLAGPRRQLAVSCFLAATAAVAAVYEYSAHLPDRLVALLATLLVGGLCLLLIRGPGRRLPAATIALAAVASVAVAEPEAQRYLRTRYNLADFTPQSSDAVALTHVFSWARGVHHARIGVEGGELQYPLYGPDLSNYVQYIGSTRPDGGFIRIERCGLWRRAINAGHYSYVITVPWGSESALPPMPSPQEGWTRTDPATVPVLEPGAGIVVFAIHGRMRGC